MLTLYSGSHLEPLVDELIGRLRSGPLKAPLAPEIVVVQNHGMARWLSTQIAGKSGIAANLKFPFPGEIIWDIYRAMDPEIPEDLPSDREPMTWTLFRLLEELPGEAPYRTVRHYTRDERGVWSPLKAWKLAVRIADLFDKYLNYRQEMLLGWERGETAGFAVEADGAEAWQSALWRKLNEIWKENKNEWRHQAQVHGQFMEHAKEGTLPAAGKLPQRINLFGLSGLQPSYIEAFVQISKQVDVNWFRMNPAAQTPDHPLVRSWGGEGEEFKSLFIKITETAGVQPDEVRINKDKSDRQASGLRPPVSLHSCHSPLREVEVLYDRLIDLFENDPDLTPDEILILTPDIETYAPFLDAVFGTAEKELPELPFHIVDEQSGTRKEVYQTFSKLLNILDSRFKVTDVLDLVSGRAVLERFGISEDELDRVQRWIEEARIRWGIDGEQKRRLELPDSPRYTWQFGIDRMILGFAARPGEEVFRDLYPLGEIESSDDGVLLGKLSRFFDELKKAWTRSREPHTPARWGVILREWLSAFIPAGRRYHRAYQGLSGLVAGMEEAADRGAFQNRVGYPVVLDLMDKKLTDEAGRGGYFGHGITFSGPDPMRTIPFKVIGMIGMNHDSFPRSRVVPDFDLMAKNPREGDRIHRNDDRYLFLETICSAGDLFYLSYVGQSDRDDSSRPPSVLVSELVDHLAEERGDKREDLITKHPLHAYSSRYFEETEQELFSYSRMRYEISKKIKEPGRETAPFLDDSLPEAEETFRQLSVGDLVRFFENPPRYLLQRRLGLYLREEEVIAEDREPFELRGLDGYKLSDELLMRNLNKQDLAGYEPVARARGWLPEGWPGERAFREKAEQVGEFGAELGRIMELPKRDPVEVDLEIGDFHLTGILDTIYGKYQFFFRYGGLRAKDLMKLWIHHLALQQVEGLDHPFSSLLATRDREDPKPEYYLLPGLKNPKELLEPLLNLYWRGIHSKMPLFADSSFSYAHELFVNRKDHESALNHARRKWYNSWQPWRSEREDPYIKMLFRDEDPLESDEFISLSRKFWEPVFEVLNREEENIG